MRIRKNDTLRKNILIAYAVLLIFIIALSVIKSAHAEREENEKEDEREDNSDNYGDGKFESRNNSQDQDISERDDGERFEEDDWESDYEWDLSNDFDEDSIKDNLQALTIKTDNPMAANLSQGIEEKKANELALKEKIDNLKKSIRETDDRIANIEINDSSEHAQKMPEVLQVKKPYTESFLHKLLRLFGLLGRE